MIWADRTIFPVFFLWALFWQAITEGGVWVGMAQHWEPWVVLFVPMFLLWIFLRLVDFAFGGPWRRAPALIERDYLRWKLAQREQVTVINYTPRKPSLLFRLGYLTAAFFSLGS